MSRSNVVFVNNPGRVEQNQGVVSHREVTVYAAEMALISLANVFAESIGDTEATVDQYLVIIRTRRSHPTSTLPGIYRASTPGSSGKRSLKR